MTPNRPPARDWPGVGGTQLPGHADRLGRVAGHIAPLTGGELGEVTARVLCVSHKAAASYGYLRLGGMRVAWRLYGRSLGLTRGACRQSSGLTTGLS